MKDNCRDLLEEAIGEIKRLSAAPYRSATVNAKIGGDLILLSNGGYVGVPGFQVAIGESVAVNNQGQIVKKIPAPMSGEKGVVMNVAGSMADVAIKGGEQTCYFAVQVDVGDHVVLNAENNCVLRKLPPPKKELVEKPNVPWDSIIGQEAAKDILREAIGADKSRIKLMAHYNKKPIKGILLYGAPGNGKTMLAKALATAMDGAQFISVKGPEILSEYVGLAEAAVRALFHRARKHRQETGERTVIFIDEADAILGSRNDTHFGMEKTIVPAFLAEMDGMEESGAFVILATNLPDSLDPAIVRDGRIDRKVHVTRPTPEDAKRIIESNLEKVPCADGLAEFGTSELYSTKRKLARIAYHDGEVHPIYLGHLTSGAMCASLVERASFIAIERDMRSGKRTSLSQEDVHLAVDQLTAENQSTDLRGVAKEIAKRRAFTLQGA